MALFVWPRSNPVRARAAYIFFAASCVLALLVAALPAAAQMSIFDKPAWEKELRRVMWRHKSCLALGDFIWEVGDAQKIITRDFSLRGTPPSPETWVPLDDVSAFVFATYLLERNKGVLDEQQIDALTMRSGFNAPMSESCTIATSVESCYGRLAVPRGEKGTFYYGPGHLQKLAMDLDLGTFRDGDMRDEYGSYIGNYTRFQFQTMRMLDGLRMTPDNLSKLLRSIVSGDLYMYEHLGENAVCLDPALCKDTKVLHAPAPRTRDYSLGHWVEKSRDGKIQAYSAAGASGIYVWISADKKYYGYVIPKEDSAKGSQGARTMGGIGCGQVMMRIVSNATAARPKK